MYLFAIVCILFVVFAAMSLVPVVFAGVLVCALVVYAIALARVDKEIR